MSSSGTCARNVTRSRASFSRSSIGNRCRRVMATHAVASEPLLKVHDYEGLQDADITQLIQRPRIDFSSIIDTVTPICDAVRERGDDAVAEFTRKFDGAEVPKSCIPIDELPTPDLPADVAAAIDLAYDNIRAFHAAQALEVPLSVETMPGVTCQQVRRPIGAVGIYIPGGTAVLPSSALMLATPAQLSGCGTVVLATPPLKDKDGGQSAEHLIAPEIAYVAKKAGVTHVLAAGGAQAVAAMAWGTQTCPKVDKIFGPGNQFVTAAKMALQSSEAMIAIDMPAGPSEVLVIADAGAPAAHVAADLLSQAEHGRDSQVVLLALPGTDLAAIEAELAAQLAALPRAEAATAALGHSFAVSVPSRAAATALSNRYAPEHLIVNTEDAPEWLDGLDNAGSVFLGRFTPESVGDYASGTNHVLPTYGYARMYSGVNLDAFCKKMTVQQLSEDGLRAIGPAVARLAEVEGLDAHRRAVTLRLGDTS